MLQPTPFLDLRTSVLSGGERGLLSVAFTRDYALSGHFYVYFTSRPNGDIEIWQFTRSLPDPNVADPAGQRLLSIPHARDNHNGGQLQWRENRLWAGTGDGGGGGDPDNNGQNPETRLGKLL